MGKKLITSALVVPSILSLLGTPGLAQNELSDPAAYLAAKQAATQTFLDSSAPKSERLLAAKHLRYPEDATFQELLQIGIDPSESDEIRLVAIRRYRFNVAYLDAVLGILADPSDGGELLNAGLIDDITRRTTFRQPAKVRQRIQNGLRDRLVDSRPAVRLAAYRALAANHDPAAISSLVDGLRRGTSPIPAADAIELLDVDGSAKHIGTLRPFLDDDNPAVRAQAARALALDPGSRDHIIRMAILRGGPVEIRVHALRALAREDEDFMSYAIELMLDREELADIRYLAMKSAVGRMNYHQVPATTQIAFAEAVRRLAEQRGPVTSDGRDLGTEAKKLSAYLVKAFPAIKRHYALG